MREVARKKKITLLKEGLERQSQLNTYLLYGDRGDHLEDGPRGHQDDEGEGDG